MPQLRRRVAAPNWA